MAGEYENFNQEGEISNNIEREAHIYENIHWEGAKGVLNYDLHLSEKDPWRIGDWLQLASLMHKFDPTRFDEEVEITDSTWEKLFKEANYRFENGYYSEWDPKYHSIECFRLGIFGVWSFAASLKKLDSKKFEQNVEIPDKHWNEITEWLNRQSRDSIGFIDIYGSALTIDAQKITERVSISEEEWETIRDALKDYPNLLFAIKSQDIKPKGFPDITTPKQEYEKILETLESWAENERSNIYDVFQSANILKYKEVKVER